MLRNPRIGSRVAGWLVAMLLASLAMGCTAEAIFTDGRSHDECNGNWPVCTHRAGCNLNEREFLQGEFPGSRRFIVETLGKATIRLTLLFTNQVSPGADSEIHWYEPGCFERYSYASDGADLFRESGKTGILEKEQLVHQPGDHMVEIFSDAVAEYLLKVSILSQEDLALE